MWDFSQILETLAPVSSVGFESNPRPRALFRVCSWRSGAVGALIPWFWSAVPKSSAWHFSYSTNIPLLIPLIQFI